MEQHQIITTIIGLGAGVLGWFVNQLYARIESMSARINQLEVEMPRHYATKDELNNNTTRLEKAFTDRVELAEKNIGDKIQNLGEQFRDVWRQIEEQRRDRK